ncbi:hypothetical protein ACFSL4_16515 [Streptomyces caeni]|uniref:Uncharacterized protein n=1 Tax=Streptomyces caeni TaxID=2307231 RepID=A0ABW4IT77_9ACTN
MAALGIADWYRRLRTLRFVATGRPPGVPPRPAGPHEGAPALHEAEHTGGEDGTRLPGGRLLLGTACGSVLLFGIAVSARVAPSLALDALTPLTTTVVGVLGAAAVTALAACVGRSLRGRSSAPRAPGLSGSPSPADEPSPQPGRERGDAP